MEMKEIVEKVKRKKELSRVNERLIMELIRKNKNYEKFLKERKKIFEKRVIKEVRAMLRKLLTPMPALFYKKYSYFLKNVDKEIERILDMNLSFRERKNNYGWLIGEIKKINPERILDIGCGFTLLAFYYFNFKPKAYIGVDIDGYVVDLINRFMEVKRIDGKVFCDFDFNFKTTRNDLILILKVLDGIEKIEKGKSEKIIEMKGKKIVSFPLVTWGRKRKIKQRVWFEKILKKHNLYFKKFEKGNEVFYFLD
jgi:hypothetical protein